MMIARTLSCDKYLLTLTSRDGTVASGAAARPPRCPTSVLADSGVNTIGDERLLGILDIQLSREHVQ